MSQYEWIILDIDDTLLDYRAGSLSALKNCLSSNGHEFCNEYYKLFSEIDSRLWIEAQLGTLTPNQVVLKRFEELSVAIKVDVDPRQLSTSYTEHLMRDIFLLPDVEDVLNALHGNCNLGAATNGSIQINFPIILEYCRLMRFQAFSSWPGLYEIPNKLGVEPG